MTRKSYYEDEIPTRPHGRSYSDPDTLLGRCMAEIVSLRKRVEILEDLVQGRAPSEYKTDPPSGRNYRDIIKKTVTYAVFGIAGVLSALRELGILK